MAGSVNKVILVGNVGKDPEIRRTQDGKPIANLTLATSESWRDKNTGEKKERTEWHRIAIFNEGLCKVVEQYVKKGAKLYIEGQLQTRKWTDQAGAERYTTEVVLQSFSHTLQMLDGRSGAAGGMGDGNQADYGNDGGAGGYSGGRNNSSGGGSSSSYGSASNGGNGTAAKSSGGTKPFDKQIDDEIPF